MAKKHRKAQPKAKDIVGKRVLVLGEAGSGKTALAARVLEELLTFFSSEEITVIDMAPKRTGEIGGKLAEVTDSVKKVRYLAPEKVHTPRLTGTSCDQVLKYAELNRRAIEPLFDMFIRRPTRVLILNDVTLYLHAGELETVLKSMRLAKTFLATAYRGSKLAEDRGSGISAREKQLVERLSAYADQIIETDCPTACGDALVLGLTEKKECADKRLNCCRS